jgi:hypothetical protein
MWGKHAHLSKVVVKESTSSKIKRLIKVTQSHTNYQCSMILEDIVGITNLKQQLPSMMMSLNISWVFYPSIRLFSAISG